MADAVVANASPLILLSRADCLELLRVAGEPVVVPRPVLAEIEMKGADDLTAQAMSRAPWLVVVPPSPVPPELAVWEPGTGESSVLAWAWEHAGSVALLDDLEARRCAESLQIPVFGTVGLVLLAKRRGVVSPAPFSRGWSPSGCTCPSALSQRRCAASESEHSSRDVGDMQPLIGIAFFLSARVYEGASAGGVDR